MGGGQHAHVHRDGLVAAQPLDVPLLQHAQQLGLGARGQVADLVEEDGAAVGLLEAADAPGLGAGEGAALVAEQLALQQRLGNGGAVDGDERLVGAVAVLVEGAGDEFLAGAGLAADQHRDRGGGHPADFLVDVLHGAAAADEGETGGAGFAQLHRLGHALGVRHGGGDQVQQFLGLERLEQILEGAELGGLDGGFGGAVGGHHDDGQLGLGRVELGDQLQAVQARAASGR